jgi:hypothetical protein
LARIEESRLAVDPIELVLRDLINAGKLAQVGKRGGQATANGALPILLGMPDDTHPVGHIDQHMGFQIWPINLFHGASPFKMVA